MMLDAEFEVRVAHFEQARHRGDRSVIAAFLAGWIFPSATERFRLLVELICFDLELGWQNSHVIPPTPLAGYLEQFPELIALDQLPIEIIVEEYRARWRWGDRPTHRDFLARFGARQEVIEPELLAIDAEIEGDATEPDGGSRSAFPLPSGAAASLRSHHEFLLHRLIGAGRMGKVYVASPRNQSQPVAIKFLRKPLLSHPDVVRRFLAEADTIARLRHPGIVGTGGLGRTPGGSYFIVMELVNGPNLAEISRQRAIELNEAILWMIETCAALEHAHGAGVVHCDLKPANLLLDPAGKIRVTDFGLARSLTAGPPEIGAVEGTVGFMAPEQASRTWGPIDARTDVYGVGAVLFTLLAGRPPLVGQRVPDVLAQVVSATPVVSLATLRPDLPAMVANLCRQCLAKAPGDRIASMRDLRLALEASLATLI